MRLVYKDTKIPVNRGDAVPDGHGDEVTVVGWTPPRHVNSSGRVEVREAGFSGTREYFPHVFDLEFVE